MASKKFPLLIFVFVLLVLIAGVGTIVYNRAHTRTALYQQETSPNTSTVSDTSNQQLDKDTQDLNNSLDSLNTDLNNVNSSMNDQPGNLQ